MSELHKQLGCLGYYGFGSGYEKAQREIEALEHEKSYCGSKCPLREACWKRHMERTRLLLPMLCDSFGRMEQTAGAIAVQAFQLVYDRPNPYTTVMMGNIEDGERVALGGYPLYRGDCTVPWPMEAN